MNTIMGFCAEGVVRDAMSNGITAYNILEGVQSAVFPLFLQRLFFFSLLERTLDEPGETDVVLKVRSSEKVIFEAPMHVDFQNQPRTRIIMGLQGLVFPAPGRVTFDLEHGSDKLVSYPIDVSLTGQPQVTTEASGDSH